jgi:cysteine desulfurase
MTRSTKISDIYLDNHATTRVDPRVIDAMLPWFDIHYANPGSVTHEAGRSAKSAIEEALSAIGQSFGVDADDVVITSGATESNNLAILGTCLHPRQKRRKVVSVVSEHHAVLGPLEKLAKLGFDVVLLPVFPNESRSSQVGQVDGNRLADAIDDNTALVSIMLANNEIGVVQPLSDIAKLCERYGVLLHTDATQAVGRIPTLIEELGVDLMSFSAHKFYGPKGIGGLIVSQRKQYVEIAPQIVGGGQQNNLRSGTLNSAGIIGMQTALQIAQSEGKSDAIRLFSLRQLLWELLSEAIPHLQINGPLWSKSMNSESFQEHRLAGNLNVCFPSVDGQSLMLETPCLAVSSGSACTSAHPEPSHVLRSLGLSEDQARTSIRFGIGRFNTDTEIRLAARWIIEAYHRLSGFVA